MGDDICYHMNDNRSIDIDFNIAKYFKFEFEVESVRICSTLENSEH